MSLLIKGVLHQGEPCDILIEGNRITQIGTIAQTAARTLDARGQAVIPAFYNTHTHAAMTCMRGLADDRELFDWLNNHIWPFEALLTPEDIYLCSRLAIVEMIQTGTVFFNDMYWHAAETVRAVDEFGVRAALGRVIIEATQGVVSQEIQRANAEFDRILKTAPERVMGTYAPHAIYTVSEATLRRVAAQANDEKAYLHIHASETLHEVDTCYARYGMSPIFWLDHCGMLTARTTLAHCVHLSDDDIALIRDRGCLIAHNPVSNMKLASGLFHYERTVEQGKCNVSIGTDGCASNNNVSMLEEMKFAALIAKTQSMHSTCAPAEAILRHATRDAAKAFQIDAGEVAVGRLADLLLIDLRNPLMVPCHNLISNLVYSADSSCINTVICDGRILMENRIIPGKDDIVDDALECCHRLISKMRRQRER